MSRIDEKPKDTQIFDGNSNSEKNSLEDVSIGRPSIPAENEEKVDTAYIQERRMSSNNELSDPRDSTPMQTDNEEVKKKMNRADNHYLQ